MRSMHDLGLFLHDRRAQNAADHDRIAVVDFEFDLVISGPILHDRMALV